MTGRRFRSFVAFVAAALLGLASCAHPDAAPSPNFSGTWRIVPSADTGPIARLPARDTDVSIEDKTEPAAEVAMRLPGYRGNDKAIRARIAALLGHPVGSQGLVRLVTISGYGGCNYFTIFYLAERTGDVVALHWYDMLETAMACPPERVRHSTERPVASDSLPQEPRLRLRNGTMLVADRHGKIVARFRRLKP